MPLDGLTIKALIAELQSLLQNSRVIKIYQPFPDTITFHFRLPGATKILLINAHPQNPGLHTIERQLPNPAAPPVFCMLLRKYLEPSRLVRISQIGLDRLVHLGFETIGPGGKLRELSLVVELFGRFSNIYLVNEEGIILDALRRFPQAQIIPGAAYQAPVQQNKLDPTKLSPEDFQDRLRLLPPTERIRPWLQQTLQGFSAQAAGEMLRRSSLDPTTTRRQLHQEDWERLFESLLSLLQEVSEGGTPAFYESEDDFSAYLLTGKRGRSFESVDSLLREMVLERNQKERLLRQAAQLRRRVNTHYKRVLKKEGIQKETLEEAEQAEQWRHLGELLRSNFHLLKKGQTELEVVDYTHPEQAEIVIALDPLLGPAANLERIFKRYRKQKAALKHMERQLRSTARERRYLEQILLQIETADEPGILREIEEELGLEGYVRLQKKRRSVAAPQPKHYLSTDGLSILVGRSNRQNDLLTFKISNPRQLWLHARNLPGSHVIILEEGEIPPTTLEQAAQLAAYFSRAREDNKVAVDYTLRQNVRKPKGSKPGFVYYSKARTIFVSPKLPAISEVQQ